LDDPRAGAGFVKRAHGLLAGGVERDCDLGGAEAGELLRREGVDRGQAGAEVDRVHHHTSSRERSAAATEATSSRCGSISSGGSGSTSQRSQYCPWHSTVTLYTVSVPSSCSKGTSSVDR